MPRKILGLDTNGRWVAAVQVQPGIKGYAVLGAAWVAWDETKDLALGLKDLAGQMDLQNDLCVASIPAENASVRNLDMPFKDLKKIGQALPFELETLIPYPIEDMVIDYNRIQYAEKSDILAAAVKKTDISRHLDDLKAHGISPDVLEIQSVPTVLWLVNHKNPPDHFLFLDIGEETNTLIFVANGRIALIRSVPIESKGLSRFIRDRVKRDILTTEKSDRIRAFLNLFSKTIKNTVHAFVLRNNQIVLPEKVFFTGVCALYPETGPILEQLLQLPAERIDLFKDLRVQIEGSLEQRWQSPLMDGALALALRGSKTDEGFNFRKDEFAVKKDYGGLKKLARRIGAFVAIILALLVVDIGLDYAFLKKKLNLLDKEVTHVFRETFPETKKIVDPLKQMQVRLTELRNAPLSFTGIGHNMKVLDVLAEISRLIPTTLNTSVSRMNIDPETVRITGITDTFNTVDGLKSQLKSSAHFEDVEIRAANLSRTGEGVQFELNITRKREFGSSGYEKN